MTFKNLLQNHRAKLHSWMKLLKVCSNEGSDHFPRGDNNEIAKLHLFFLSRHNQFLHKCSQMSDVAHGPLILFLFEIQKKEPYSCLKC